MWKRLDAICLPASGPRLIALCPRPPDLTAPEPIRFGRCRTVVRTLMARARGANGGRLGAASGCFLPGFSRPFGSSAAFTRSCAASVAASHCAPRNARLTQPTPCSPLIEPPSLSASWSSRSPPVSRALELLIAGDVDEERPVHDPIPRVTPSACRQRELLADRIHRIHRLAQALRRDAYVLADLAPADPREHAVEHRRASARAQRARAARARSSRARRAPPRGRPFAGAISRGAPSSSSRSTNASSRQLAGAGKEPALAANARASIKSSTAGLEAACEDREHRVLRSASRPRERLRAAASPRGRVQARARPR